MDNRLYRSTRFFARPLAFDLECPHCGTVYQIRSSNRGDDLNYDPFTARFRCTTKRCQRVYVIGLLAWPIIKAPNVASAPPADQVPGPRQLVQLRKEGGGWWLPEEDGQRYPRPHETNLTIEEDRPDDEDDDNS